MTPYKQVRQRRKYELIQQAATHNIVRPDTLSLLEERRRRGRHGSYGKRLWRRSDDQTRFMRTNRKAGPWAYVCFCLLIVPLDSGTLLASRTLPSGSGPGSQICTSLQLARLRLSPTAVTADVISRFTEYHTVRICVLRRLLDGINDRHISQSGYSEEVRFCILRTPTR